MSEPVVGAGDRFTIVKWTVCGIAALGFVFDIYEHKMLPLREAVLGCTQALQSIGRWMVGACSGGRFGDERWGDRFYHS